MNKIEARVQHVSIFRIRSVYLIGALYEFESNNQEGTLDVIIQGNNISFAIDEASGPKNARTAMSTASVHILSAGKPVPMFNVSKGHGATISVPVFSPNGPDYVSIAGEFVGVIGAVRKTLSITPETTSDLPADVIAELGIEERAAVARDWGWRGW
ncbi:MAG: hypothetical protein JSS31_11720 [Proteobacteria bacterium]|nr:hypothetical protein [Pseudomonadota bacterium]MBS0494599.1 hypothetical protein [Pseudomonadota bacterium]